MMVYPWERLPYIGPRLGKRRFALRLQKIRDRRFCIISSNCIGSVIYQILRLPYNTPTVGLFFPADDFLRLASDPGHYLRQQPKFDLEAGQAAASTLQSGGRQYPVGRLDDIRVHFMHYQDEHEAAQKWERRTARIDWDRLHFVFTDRDGCSPAMLRAFDALPLEKKVCFTAGRYPFTSCIPIPAYAGHPQVGDLMSPMSTLMALSTLLGG